MAQLEGDIFVRNRRCPGRLRLRCTLVEVVGCATRTATVTLASSAAFGSSAKQNQIVGYDFRHVLLLIGLLVVPGARLQAALDVDLAAFLEILTRNFCKALPEHHVVPFGSVLPRAALVFEAFVGGHGDLRNRCALRCVLHFGVLAKIADKNDFVNALWHECVLLRRVTIAERDRWKLWYLDRLGVTNGGREAGGFRRKAC